MTNEQIEKLDLLTQKFIEADKKNRDYFEQFLHIKVISGGKVVKDKPATKFFSPQEHEILKKLREERREAEQNLIDFTKQI